MSSLELRVREPGKIKEAEDGGLGIAPPPLSGAQPPGEFVSSPEARPRVSNKHVCYSGLLVLLSISFHVLGQLIAFELRLIHAKKKNLGESVSNAMGIRGEFMIALVESIKLVVTSCLYCASRNQSAPTTPALKFLNPNPSHKCKSYFIWVVPAIMFALTNNLGIFSVTLTGDPVVPNVVASLEALTTGVLSVIFLKRRLLTVQWSALVLLMASVASSEISAPSPPASFEAGSQSEEDSKFSSAYVLGIVCALGSCLSSSFGSVYSELFLKKQKKEFEGSSVIMSPKFQWQMLQLYFWGLTINIVGLVFDKGGPAALLDDLQFRDVNWLTICLVVNYVALGLTTALILRHLSALTKTLISIASIYTNALATVPAFGYELNLGFCLALINCAIAIFLFRHGSSSSEKHPGLEGENESLLGIRQLVESSDSSGDE